MKKNMKKRQKHVLKLYMNALLVGRLTEYPNGALEFSYDRNYLARTPNLPISRSLPIQEESYSGPLVLNYFDNLLPDNTTMRQLLAQKTQANSAGAFDLLWNIGRDCVGALQFIPENSEPDPLYPLRSHPLSISELAQRLRRLEQTPLGVDPAEDFRISIAGAQEKTGFLLLNDAWHVPLGATPTTHIFKTSMGTILGNVDMSLSVENEWLCLEICKAYGLNVAEASIGTFEEIKTLIVKRFDRQQSDGRIYRIPQEDFCQALNYASNKKYENDGGPGIRQIMEVLNESNLRENDRNHFMKTQVVFWLMAAIDGHAKNFSLSWVPDGFQLTPVYDVMSAFPVVATGRFQEEKIKLAMTVGTNRHFKLKGIARRHWMQTASLVKMPKETMAAIIDEIIQLTPQVLASVEGRLPARFPLQISQPIFEGMKKNLSHLTAVRLGA